MKYLGCVPLEELPFKADDLVEIPSGTPIVGSTGRTCHSFEADDSVVRIQEISPGVERSLNEAVGMGIDLKTLPRKAASRSLSGEFIAEEVVVIKNPTVWYISQGRLVEVDINFVRTVKVPGDQT